MIPKYVQQIEFSSVLFDTLFGLVLYFSLDSFLDIRDPFHFIFYLFSTIILVHWWLMFKSVDDLFREEVTNSAVDLVFGIIYLILIEYIILSARDFHYLQSIGFVIALLSIDCVWAIAWKYIGKWKTDDEKRIQEMEKELGFNVKLNLPFIIIYLCILIAGYYLPASIIILLFITAYIIDILLTFKYKIIDIKIF